MTTYQQIKLTSIVQPHFFSFWNSKAPYLILNGGRGSFKSSTISVKLLVKFKKHVQQGDKVNVVIVRENAVNLRDSVYGQIVWAISKLGMIREFRYSVSPMKIVHKRTGSTFYFYGGDNPERLKSNTVGDLMALWYEEAANFKSAEVFDQTNPTFIRQKAECVDQVQVIYSYNPPKNPFDWVNEWVDEKIGDPDYFVDKSTYLDDELGFTTKQQLALIESYKKNDYDYYRWLYLGEVIGLGNNVYNMALFHEIDELPDDDYVAQLAYSIDVGHQTSATTCLCIGITGKGNVIVLDTYYYSPEGRTYKKAPSELSKDLHEFIKESASDYPNAPIIKRTIDSAEGGLRNQYYNDYGTRLHGVNKAMKKVTMVDYPQDLLAQGRVFILRKKENEIFIEQHQQYRWEDQKTGKKNRNPDDPQVVKENDHTCDAFQYFCMDNKRLLGLKK
ncbi:PBSX family phage terminase large subunit [Latilactobacillus sakei]|uniref:PBSX family phage terminase large subunit n=1 Tax=Latilactobacillus sakei TaxID=1599 RepID=UPI000EAACC2C|nr:PBSX family phage terminase large subunit [Latilactobacillus sakei]AYG17288.1 PBSX family phage terminase large subunit [Latilactobacillus sakei]AYG26384.1 PBSX family phage terminase large subunit [Latilactobacillus sakei]AYG31294.1 PBSX family phage terminase large subunit [Latilactobacillus sakei]AYG33191.1 PBSX family phage terminase large subunit [Latilactobacillus sakei]